MHHIQNESFQLNKMLDSKKYFPFDFSINEWNALLLFVQNTWKILETIYENLIETIPQIPSFNWISINKKRWKNTNLSCAFYVL